MIGRAGCSAQSLHLLHQEGHQLVGVQQSLRFLIQISLVGRAAAFGYEEEFIFIALFGMNLNLSRQIAAGVHLLIHGKRRILRITEIVFGVRFVNAVSYLLLIVATGPYMLTFVTCADCRARILAHGQNTFGTDIGVAQHGQSHETVVVAGFGIR